MVEPQTEMQSNTISSDEKALTTIQQDYLTKDVTRFGNLANIDALIAYVTPFVNSNLCPFDRPADAALAYIWAMDKQVSPVDAFNHLVIVNGRVGTDSFLARAMLQRQGVFATIDITNNALEDYRPLYSYQYRTDTYTQDDIDNAPQNYVIFNSMESLKIAVEKKSVPDNKIPVVRSTTPYDYRTRLTFIRKMGNTVLKERGEFTMSAAAQAKLTEKSNWKNYPKECLYARAYMTGARRIASDLMMATYSKEELYSEADMELQDSDFEIIE